MRAPLLPPSGATGIRLPPGLAREAVRAGLARRAHGSSVVVIADDEVRVEDRATLIAHYRRVGVRELYTRLRGALVPAGFALGLLDGERVTRVTLLDLEALLGPAPSAPALPIFVPSTPSTERNTTMPLPKSGKAINPGARSPGAPKPPAPPPILVPKATPQYEAPVEGIVAPKPAPNFGAKSPQPRDPK